MSDSLRDDYRNEGHGHVFPRPDGIKARCGGPTICRVCSLEFTRKINGAKEPTVMDDACRTINVMLYRAQPVGSEGTPHLRIITGDYFPGATTAGALKIAADMHREEAKVLVDALCLTLSGGTIDQILRELLERKASQLVVKF